VGSTDWLLAVVGAVAVRVTKGPPQRLDLHERRDRLAMLLTALPAEDEAALNLAMRVALPIIGRLIDQAHRSPISTVDRTLDTPSRTQATN